MDQDTADEQEERPGDRQEPPPAETVQHVLKLAYQSLGVIYGDLGTSPLYVFSSTFHLPPTEKEILGTLSLICWTITLIGLVKYVMIVLNAHDNGEGGTVALYTLLCRHVNVSVIGLEHKPSAKMSVEKCERTKEHSNSVRNRYIAYLKAVLGKPSPVHTMLLGTVMAGTCMVLGDGILTPAISVLSAIEGIQVVSPSLKTNVILAITCLILVALFLLQRFGTDKVSDLFAPMVTIWLLSIAGIGLYNIIVYKPGIFQALSPHHGILFLRHGKKKGWMMLGGVVLSITGTEALFADVGHFSPHSIQIAFAGLVYPCLLLAYFGQGAFLTKYPNVVESTFYESIPRGFFWPMFVIATLATIVASQAMISGSFSVINQSLNLGCFPKVKVIHTSKTVKGQIYIPEVNYILMVACVVVVLGFQHSSAIGNAYGIAVVSVMLITTTLMTIVIVLVWHRLLLGALFFFIFGCIEGLYLSAVLYKITLGGWVPLVIAAVFLTIMCIWKYGTMERHKFELQHMVAIEQLDKLLDESCVARVPGVGFFYTGSDRVIPPAFSHFIENLPALHHIMVFIFIKSVPVKRVLPDERVFVRQLASKNFYQCVIYYGYNETPIAGQAFDDLVVGKIAQLIRLEHTRRRNSDVLSALTSSEFDIVEELCNTSSTSTSFASAISMVKTSFQLQTSGSVTPPPPNDPKSMEEEQLSRLFAAKEKGVVYVVARTKVQAKAGSKWHKRILLMAYSILRSFCRSDFVMLSVPTQRLIEVSTTYDL